jgi:hypothetical protein
MALQEVVEDFMQLTQSEPPERCDSPGVLLGLLSFVVAVKPFADIDSM